MAGRGSRFAEQGYANIKPLVEIKPGLPMIEAVVNSIGIDGDFVFVIHSTHENTDVVDVLRRIRPDCKIISEYGVLQGAATTMMHAEPHVDSNRPLFIVNSDNILAWDGEEQYRQWIDAWPFGDGMIATFQHTDPRYSYVRTNEHGYVVEVAEKRVISDMATAGLYGWESAASFYAAARDMINAEDRMNGEFYVAPTFNYNLKRGTYYIRTVPVQFHGVGTPEELRIYQAHLLGILPPA